MKRSLWIPALIGLALAVWGALSLRGQFLNVFLVVLGLLAAALVLLAWAGLALLRRKLPRIAAIRHGVAPVGIVLVVFSLSYPLGTLVHRRDVQAAIEYCEEIASLAERWREQHGSYPDTIHRLEIGDLPDLLEGATSLYVSDGDGFVIAFSDRADVLETARIYTSQDRAWYRAPSELE